MALVFSLVNGCANGVQVYSYDNLDTADSSPDTIEPGGTEPLAGSIQAVGTFGGGTVALQGSNDGTNWANLLDTAGTEIGLTAAGISDFSVGCRYIRPLVTSGSGDDIDVFICLRG